MGQMMMDEPLRWNRTGGLSTRRRKDTITGTKITRNLLAKPLTKGVAMHSTDVLKVCRPGVRIQMLSKMNKPKEEVHIFMTKSKYGQYLPYGNLALGEKIDRATTVSDAFDNSRHLDWITVRRDDDVALYTFKEGDFHRLRIQDIEIKSAKTRTRILPFSDPRGFTYENKQNKKEQRLLRIENIHKVQRCHDRRIDNEAKTRRIIMRRLEDLSGVDDPTGVTSASTKTFDFIHMLIPMDPARTGGILPRDIPRVEGMKRKVMDKGVENKEALIHLGRRKPGQYICCVRNTQCCPDMKTVMDPVSDAKAQPSQYSKSERLCFKTHGDTLISIDFLTPS
ncbi:hypothetical protein Tco_1383717 [Tanacetum coccineum]